ncbi:hypothetical protein ESCO_000357 [Escovopsis weberi]|uniref:Maintenance of telomere capping protein 4 n=1 Tax=Escovopsis weberi TaxID=150374 RepID=A0A0M9VTR0_ESCWE|nr:hypothetical protein ESCO_000357 [Escovopsis weberi]
MLGRQYNPLQYVRNRKVRARERQTIDGERQGFGDVTDVKSWVDSVSSQMSLAGTSLLQGRISIPIFPGAEEVYNQDSAVSLARTASAPRGRRPRVDWFVEPCDMIADAYWLEKDRHKDLIEDRHWRKIFPTPLAELNRTMPVSGEEDSLGRPSLLLPRFAEQHESGLDEGESGLTKIRTDVTHNSAKERAKQKLQHFRDGFHHRHSPSVHAHDLLRLKKGSSSDLSDSDEDTGNEGKKRSRPSRKGTISSDSNDLLQKQMLEMLAREAMENELEEVPESPELGMVTSSDRQLIPKASGRFASRRGSLADYSDSEPKYALGKSHSESSARRGPHANYLSTSSAGNQSSNVNSPEQRPAKPLIVEPAGQPEPLPPLSRSASPVRKPLDKIKRILRDKSNELIDLHAERAEDEGDSRISRSRSQSGAGFGKQSRRQPSPNGNFLSPNLDGTKAQRINSKRPKADEAVGLRGMFKGPRIDTVIRDSVFRLGDKLGDKIWKREATTESPDLDATSDSDNDKAKRASPLALSRKASGKIQHGRAYMKKHFLDSMPQFQHAPDNNRLAHVRLIDPLKAPSPDDCNGAAAPYLPTTCKPCSDESDVSETESSPGALEAAQSAPKCLKPALTTTRPCETGRPLFSHWSPADRGAVKPLALSRREVARMRTLILSSGIKAREIHRRALEQHRPFSRANLAANSGAVKQEPGGLPWSEILELGPKHPELLRRQVPLHQTYPFAAQALSVAIQSWGHKWQLAAGRFTSVTSVELGNRAWDVRTLLVEDLSEMTRKAADEADETSRDLALGQPLKIKHVVDTIEKMLRKRRRRFRWIRRGMWLTVEWLLVGLMWYVWFMVMILRIFLGVGRGVFGCVKWLLWL